VFSANGISFQVFLTISISNTKFDIYTIVNMKNNVFLDVTM